MATPESIAIRRAGALERAESAATAIATATGAEIAPYPPPHKQVLMRDAIEAEWLADTLEAVSDSLTAPASTKSSETNATPTTDLTTLTRAELDEYANTLGLDQACTLPNKPAVIALIEEHLTQPNESEEIPGVEGTRPDDVEPGVQIDAQGGELPEGDITADEENKDKSS